MKRFHPAASTITGSARLVLFFTAALSLTLLPSTGLIHAAGTESEPTGTAVFQVEVGRDELTVDVRQIPLARVLEVVGERGGVAMMLHGDLAALITDSFVGLPLEEGIRRLARGHSTAVTYGVAPGGSGTVRLAEIRVIARGSGTPSRGATAPPRSQPPDSRVAEAAGEPAITLQIGEIQRLAADVAHGSEAALTRLAEIASDPDAALREQAVAALARLDTVAAEPALVAALFDVDVSVRVRAVRGLRTVGTDTAAASLVDVLIADADPQVRLTALAAVGSLSGPRVPTMLQKASTDPDMTVRETALRWLAWWRSRGSAAP